MTVLLEARPLLIAARLGVGGDPGTGAARPRQGGLPPARPDQRYAPPFPAAVPPGRGNIVRARQVIISGPNEGLFEYVGTPALGNPPILWAVAPGTATDPSGNALAVSGGLAVARYSAGIIQQLVWLDPTTGSLFLGAGPRTSTYRMASATVANATAFELDITSPFDTAAAPINVGVRMIAGPGSNAGQYLVASPAGAAPIGKALQELGVGGSGVGQTLALGVGIPITDTVYRWVIDRNGLEQWGPGGAAALDLSQSRAGAGQMQIGGSPAAGTYLLTLAPTGSGIAGEHIIMNSAADLAFAAGVAGDTNPRLVLVGAQMQFGSGAATPDATITRTGAGILLVGPAGAAQLFVNGTGPAGTKLFVGTGPTDLQGTLFLEDAAAPATPATSTAFYSKTGRPHAVGEDGNDRNLGTKFVTVAPALTISSITFVNVTGASVAVGALQYHIKVKVWYTSSAAAGTPQFQLSAPANTSPSFMANFIQGSVTPTVRAGTGSLTPGVGPTLPAAGTNAVADMEFDATFTSAGTVQLQALTSAVADTFVVQLVYITLSDEN